MESHFAPLLKEWHYLTFLEEFDDCSRDALIAKSASERHLRLYYRPAFDCFLRQFADMQGHELGSNMIEHLAWWRLYLFEDRSIGTWKRLVDDSSRKPSFDICPEYALINRPDLIDAALEAAPDLRVIIMLRDPLSRLVSHLAMHGPEPLVQIDANEWRRVLGHNEASAIIARYAAHFPPERIFLGFMEDLKYYPEEFAARVAAFVGAATPRFIPPPANVTAAPITDRAAFACMAPECLVEIERLQAWTEAPLLRRWKARVSAGLLDGDEQTPTSQCFSGPLSPPNDQAHWRIAASG